MRILSLGLLFGTAMGTRENETRDFCVRCKIKAPNLNEDQRKCFKDIFCASNNKARQMAEDKLHEIMVRNLKASGSGNKDVSMCYANMMLFLDRFPDLGRPLKKYIIKNGELVNQLLPRLLKFNNEGRRIRYLRLCENCYDNYPRMQETLSTMYTISIIKTNCLVTEPDTQQQLGNALLDFYTMISELEYKDPSIWRCDKENKAALDITSGITKNYAVPIKHSLDWNVNGFQELKDDHLVQLEKDEASYKTENRDYKHKKNRHMYHGIKNPVCCNCTNHFEFSSNAKIEQMQLFYDNFMFNVAQLHHFLTYDETMNPHHDGLRVILEKHMLHRSNYQFCDSCMMKEVTWRYDSVLHDVSLKGIYEYFKKCQTPIQCEANELREAEQKQENLERELELKLDHNPNFAGFSERGLQSASSEGRCIFHAEVQIKLRKRLDQHEKQQAEIRRKKSRSQPKADQR